MYKKINYITAVLVLLASISVNAQVTTQSPYSRYGIGNLRGSLLPQLRAMGGISTAVNKPTGYSVINMQNPASYAGITLTTIDVGMSAGFTTLTKDDAKDKSFNATLSHLALAFPITTHSALSFGILPYSELGYNFAQKSTISGSATNGATQNVTSLYTGEGGLTKAYMGYGYRIGDNFRIGANVEYLFGNLIENKDLQFTDNAELDAGATSTSYGTRLQNKNSVAGVAFSYGAQYDIHINSKMLVTLGYSGSSASTVNSTRTFLATKYAYDGTEDGGVTIETIDSTGTGKSNLKLPLVHNFGIVLQKYNRWMVGADVRMGKWSNLTINGVNQGLQNSRGASIGGQITPDITSINSYWSKVDYRLGFSYDKTYIKLTDNDVKQVALTFGVGLPLANSRNAFYKLNFTTEIGRRGTMVTNDLRENYVNLHLGFTINDKWFTRFKFD
ncbi:hypothetical protein SAMN06265348_103414 [Pedobacter westerhofensis]|uniref:Long-chain fatty acid transport protein n=1 Tax=Pedobacter westerhofensis TaxID=425512 RepID=A0A521CBX9_9SPHI|nr:outer membrane protein transport protein [Pedobacter westerhofensis]SMO56865.1 hypothetical protein SAMN06265348_103414 [Pedobacter westerhofensis]